MGRSARRVATPPGRSDDAAHVEQDLRAEVGRLRAALAVEREGREQREREWLEFTRAMASLGVAGTPPPPGFLGVEVDPAEVDPADVAEEGGGDPAQLDPGLRRAAEIRRDLRALLLGEQVLGLDVLEVGRVSSGATGPVVLRLLDDRGRPAGMLASERLRLECSRAARSVTLVFEDGYERFGDQIVPFGSPPEEAGEQEGTAGTAAPGEGEVSEAAAPGSRRIELPHVDPSSWIELLPELFRPEDVAPVPDDGQWERVVVLEELNRLLRSTTRGGRWRLRELGGVADRTLREVHLEQLDGDERVVQRIFADRLRIEREGTAVLLSLEDGVAERGGKRAPFLDGRYRIFLPAASLEEWRSAELPHALDPPDPGAPGRPIDEQG